MAGAFVAVADDATATWWNPAGIATGAYFSTVFEKGQLTEPSVYPDAGPATRSKDTGFALSVPSLGLSYYRMHISEIRPLAPTESGPDDRQDLDVRLRKFAVSQYGVTVGQSVGQGFVLASTLKLARVGEEATVVPSDGDGLDAADELKVSVDSKADIDLGAMVSVGSLRLGVTVKHLFEPDFDALDGPLTLERQARLGAAFLAGSPGAGTGLTVAFDVDLTKTATLFGDVRHLAVGAEGRLGGWLGVRGGFSANTVGDARTSWSGGLSLGGGGFFVDGALTFGNDDTREGWNVGVRLAL